MMMRIHGVALGCLTVLSAASGFALAGPLPMETVEDAVRRLDISFQDHRRASESGRVPGVSGILETGDPEDLGSVHACFAEGSNPTPEMMAAVAQAMNPGYGSRYNANASWAGSPGTPVTITWSFVPDGLSIPSGIGEPTANSNLFSRMDTLFASVGGRNTWIAAFEQSFARWGALTGVTYVRVTSGANPWDDGAAWGSNSSANRGMVRISMKNIDGASNVLAYNAFPTNGDMVIDSSESWASGGNNFRFLRNVIMHEHGHGLGFAHVCPINNSKLMEPFLSTSFDGLQQDDVRGGQRSYGDPNEPNGSSGTATPLGTIAAGATVTQGTIPSPAITNAANLSIHGDGDTDWFSFTITEPRLVRVTATPVGSSYVDVDQNQNGTCQTTGNTVNALATADLVVTVYGSNGTTILRTSNTTPAGSAEAVIDLLLSPAGTYYARISENGTPTESQLYTLAVNVRGTNLVSAATSTLTDRVSVTWTSVPDATEYRVWRNTTDTTAGASNIATGLTNNAFDDTTAIPGQDYFYFVSVQQPGNSGFRFISFTGAPGLRVPSNIAPVANAGPDQTVTDIDNNGSEIVTLDGSASTDPDGSITNYRWHIGATTLATGPSATANVSLPVGVSNITLTVTDNESATASDTVVITVNPAPSGCGSADFDGDGDAGTDSDIEAFFACLAGACCPTCGSADFDGDGDAGTDADIEAFFRVLAGGAC